MEGATSKRLLQNARGGTRGEFQPGSKLAKDYNYLHVAENGKEQPPTEPDSRFAEKKGGLRSRPGPAAVAAATGRTGRAGKNRQGHGRARALEGDNRSPGCNFST